MIISKIVAGSQSKSMTPNFGVVVNVLMPVCCHIGSGMPYFHIFVEEIIIRCQMGVSKKYKSKYYCL